jgi:hypothetical protein
MPASIRFRKSLCWPRADASDMRSLLLAAVLLSLLISAAGCALPGWKPPKPPYIDLQGNSDDYTASKWARQGSR